MSLKVQTIAKQLSPRFPARNYGLAHGIPASEMKLQGSNLVFICPPYLPDSKRPLSAFLCSSASRMVHLESFKNGLDSDMLKMAFPVMIGPKFETFGHGIGLTTEGEKKYLVGLTPFDTALGLHGVTRLDHFWKRFIVSKYQELEMLVADRVFESAGWDLLGKYESFIPLAARNLEGNRLGLFSLQLNIENEAFFFNTTSRIVYFHESSAAFIGEWGADQV